MDREEVLRDRTVLIAGDRIAAIGDSAVSISESAQVVDGDGQYLIPGLWDMHVHALNHADLFFPRFLAHGITGIRDMGGFPDSLRAVRGRLQSGDLVGPRLVSAGPLLDGPRHPWSHEVAWHVEHADEVPSAVDSLIRVDVDFLKIYSTLSRQVYVTLVDVAGRRGLSFAGHVPFSITAGEASDLGQASLEHAGLDITALDCVADGATRMQGLLGVWGSEGYNAYLEGLGRLRQERDTSCVQALYARYRTNGTAVTPTIVNTIKDSSSVDWQALSGEPDQAKEVCNATVESFHEATDAVRSVHYHGLLADVGALHRAGVLLLAGTDMPNPCLVAGASLHDELEWLVQAGLTPFEALQTATVNPGRFLDAADTRGTVRPGMLADLVLLAANPLNDITALRRVTGVVLAGRFFEPEALEQAR